MQCRAYEHIKTIMDYLASLLWNPVLSLLYIELGILFLFLTRGIVFRRTFTFFKKLCRKEDGDSHRLISHKKAFLASIATTVGVGNLAGVGTAIHLGGPGSLFWMWVSALLGMSFRMMSTYMAIKSNPADEKSNLFGTPMAFIEKYLKGVSPWLAPTMATILIVKGLVVANLIQANSVAQSVHNELGASTFIVAILLALAVGAVIIGGMRVIIDVSSALAPWMVLLYAAVGGLVLLMNPLDTLAALSKVFQYAFTPHAAIGGAAGYTVLQTIQFGISRGVFSHASGIGIAPFLQGANKDHPAEGAFMAAVTPVVDTLIICTITGLVVISGGMWSQYTGAYLTAYSFHNALGQVGYLLVTASLIVFAFTTIIGWFFYTEKCYVYLGGKNIEMYRYIFVAVTFIGPFLPIAFVWSLGDILVASLLIVNLIPLTYILIKQLRVTRKDLFAKLDP